MAHPHLKTALFWLGSFLLPMAILCTGAALAGVQPFGSLSFMEADLRYQYADFFAWYRDVLLGDADPFYSTAQGLGNSTAAMFGYYLASPFNLLLPFFDERAIPLFCFIITVLKTGCIQLTTSFYLRKRFGLGPLWTCALALGFTLSVWTLTQLRNPMWMDGLVFLPLCAWGVCCLLRHGQWRLLAMAYGACVLTNWYMGYMIGLFLCLYVMFEGYALGFEGVRSWGGTHRRRLVLFCAAMALGLAISAIVFLPSVLSMMSNGTSVDSEGQFQQIQTLIAKRMPSLAGVPVEALFAAAACAPACVLALVFFCFRKRSLRMRAAISLFVLLVCCLATCLIMPVFQHGTLPNVLRGLLSASWEDSQVPQLFGNCLVLIAAGSFFFLKNIPSKLKLAASLFLFLILLSCWLYPLAFIWGGFRLPSGYHSRMSFLFIFMLLWCASAALRCLTQGETASRMRSALVRPAVPSMALALVAIGTILRIAFIWPTIFGFISSSIFDEYTETATIQAEELEQRDPGIYRVEKAYWKFNEESLNEGMTLNVSQISSYTSTGDSSVMAFLTALGCGDGKFFTYEPSGSLATDSLFGVKYLSAPAAPQGYEDAGFTPIELPGATPGFEEVRFYENPYALSLAYGVPESITDFTMPEGTRWECVNVFAQAVWGEDAPLYLHADGSDEPELDMGAFQQMIADLKEHEFAFDEFGGSRISGTVDAAEDQVLLMTIPNQDGWSVTVNGNAVEPQDVANGALMAIPVQPGENRVEMQFTTPGLHAGAALSMLALLFVLFAPRIARCDVQKGRSKLHIE